MNLPNKLTILRVLLIPVFVVVMSFESIWTQLAAALVFGAACLTDYFDGNIARKRNLITDFGKFADPIADKLLVMSAYVLLVGQGRMPAWVCIIVLAREFTISGFRLVAVGSGRVLAAGKLGKLKTFSQMISIIAFLMLVPFDGADALLGQVGIICANVAMYFALVMTVWSGTDYIVRNRDCIKDM